MQFPDATLWWLDGIAFGQLNVSPFYIVSGSWGNQQAKL